MKTLAAPGWPLVKSHIYCIRSSDGTKRFPVCDSQNRAIASLNSSRLKYKWWWAHRWVWRRHRKSEWMGTVQILTPKILEGFLPCHSCMRPASYLLECGHGICIFCVDEIYWFSNFPMLDKWNETEMSSGTLWFGSAWGYWHSTYPPSFPSFWAWFLLSHRKRKPYV